MAAKRKMATGTPVRTPQIIDQLLIKLYPQILVNHHDSKATEAAA